MFGESTGHGLDATFSKGVFTPAVCALPSITWCNWASVLTGEDPKDHGVYGNSFFRRDLPAERPIFSGNDKSSLKEHVIYGGPLRGLSEGLSWLLHNGDNKAGQDYSQLLDGLDGIGPADR